MAKQIGLIKLKGTLDDISMYKGRTKVGKKEALARTKGGVDAETIATSPAFQRTRENNSEFGRAGSAGKAVRQAFAPQLQAFNNPLIPSQLTKEMRRLIDLDTVAPRGQRQVLPANIASLEGFKLNPLAQLDSALGVKISAVFTTPNVVVSIPVFTPVTNVRPPQGATHMKIKTASASIDFSDNSVDVSDSNESAYIDLFSAVPVAAQTINNDLTGATAGNACLTTVSIEFFQLVNTAYYPLSNGAYSPCEILFTNLFA